MTMPVPDAWSYSGDPAASDRDQVRFYLQDVDPAVRLLADSEIDFLIGVWKDLYNGSLVYVAAVGAEVIAGKFTGVTSVEGDGVAVDLTKLAPAYAGLAVQLRKLYDAEQIGGTVDIANLMWSRGIDPTMAPLRFGVGDMDNPEAGLQDYGGLNYNSGWWDMVDAAPGG